MTSLQVAGQIGQLFQAALFSGVVVLTALSFYHLGHRAGKRQALPTRIVNDPDSRFMDDADALADRLLELAEDNRLDSDDANVQINAPLALTQVSLKAERRTIRWALADPDAELEAARRRRDRDAIDETTAASAEAVIETSDFDAPAHATDGGQPDE